MVVGGDKLRCKQRASDGQREHGTGDHQHGLIQHRAEPVTRERRSLKRLVYLIADWNAGELAAVQPHHNGGADRVIIQPRFGGRGDCIG